MKTLAAVIAGTLAAGASALVISWAILSHPALPASPSNRFPILSRFELPRDYGYFIGDEIPLTLVIETTSDVILNLVNLPQPGDKHGLFEIRDLTITSASPRRGHTVYRAAYILQYFGATPLRAQFERLEVLYALPNDRVGPDNTYAYKSLFTQPVTINLARISPLQTTPAINIKGPLSDRRSGLIWTGFTAGGLLLLTAVCGWLWEWRRHCLHQRAQQSTPPSAVDTALQALRQHGFARPLDEPVVPVALRLSQIIRKYLQDAFALPAFALTTTELASCLDHQPLVQELLYILTRCDTLKYQQSGGSPAEERQLWWEALALFEKLHRADSS
jgi:hypothetical protein